MMTKVGNIVGGVGKRKRIGITISLKTPQVVSRASILPTLSTCTINSNAITSLFLSGILTHYQITIPIPQ